MNAPLPTAGAVNGEMVARARAASRASGRPVYAELEALSGLDARAFVHALGALLHSEVVETAAMLSWSPALDLLPLPRAIRRDCLVFRRGESELVAVIPDPFDRELRDWLDSIAGGRARSALALRADIQACLTKLEESARAMDAIRSASGVGGSAETAGESLSISAISEDESEVVKIVNSTLYDAIKEGVSDIHLRSQQIGRAHV